ncbi:MAG: AMP-binding protein [Actinomycetia bacterium]|nr:AMP-binding protein [Actinomycetes bacterium]
MEQLHTDLSIGQYFEQMAAAHPDRDFVVMPDRGLRWSYAQFDERVDNLAKALLVRGIKAGDHVGIWARNVPDWLTFMFATAKIGAVLVTVNPVYKSHELAYVLKQADLKALAIIDAYRDVDYVKLVRELIPESLTDERGQLASSEFPQLKMLIYLGPEKYKGFFSMPELLLLGEHTDDTELRAAVAATGPDEVVNMQYTSGTTGFPKGVQLTSRNILNNGFFIGERQRLTGEDRVCLPVPLFHCFGCVLGIMAILTHGATTILLEEFNPFLVLAAVEKEKATALYGVPTMFIAELEHPAFDQFDLSSLRTGIMAGSPCPVDIMKRVVDDMHCKDITITYGLTEASPAMTMSDVTDPLEARCETVGKKMPVSEVRIIDPETGIECPPGVPGEMCARGYNVMKGYYNMEDATAEAIDEDGWLHSGDIGTLDEDGYYRITGRIKDMIIRGGENIYPREIEEFLYPMDGVKDVQVVGAPDEKYGEIGAAFIIKNEGSDLSADEVREYCYDRMARYKAPKYICFVEEFPMTGSGKVKKFMLRDQIAEWLEDGTVEPAPTYKLSAS